MRATTNYYTAARQSNGSTGSEAETCLSNRAVRDLRRVGPMAAAGIAAIRKKTIEILTRREKFLRKNNGSQIPIRSCPSRQIVTGCEKEGSEQVNRTQKRGCHP